MARTAIWPAAAVLGAVCGAWGQGPYLELYDPEEWTLEVTVNISAWQERVPSTRLPHIESFGFDTAAIVFPVLARSATHVLNERDWKSRIRLGDRDEPAKPELLPDYHSGTRLGKWALLNWAGNEVELMVTLPVTCSNTRLNEEAASKVDWPRTDWPIEAASTFDPQWFIDLEPGGRAYDMSPVRALLARWIGKNDPKALKPVPLAKYLAGELWGAFQPSGNGLNFNRRGQLEGIDLMGAPAAANRLRGSEFDMVCLLAAVYREAGLPARIVVGYDIGEEKDDDRNLFLEKGDSASLRAWVEFAIFEETAQQTTWIPVDVVRMRKASSRPADPALPWKFFGTHDELNGMIPFSFHFHPQTTVRAYGSPGFWGWLVTPKPPERAMQALTFQAFRTPQRGADPARQPGGGGGTGLSK